MIALFGLLISDTLKEYSIEDDAYPFQRDGGYNITFGPIRENDEGRPVKNVRMTAIIPDGKKYQVLSNETGKCVFDDDMGLIYDAIRTADRIILASPIFFFALSAQTKIMIDRCQSIWCEKYLLKRPIEGGQFGRKGLLLLVGGMKKDIGIQCGEACAKAFFRTISVPEHKTLFYLGVDQKGDIMKHPTALEDAYKAGKKLVKE